MNAFDLNRINRVAPYKVEFVNDEYVFETDYDIRYSVWFEPQPIPGSNVIAYWLNLTNRSQKASPRDVKIRNTVIFILEEFFRQNPDILLCDEPTGALDYNTGKTILKLLSDMCKEKGMTVIVITHNQAIAPMADRIINIKNGFCIR